MRALDPVEILSVSGGRRITDALEVFPKLERQPDGFFQCRFFLHGSSHVNSAAQERLHALVPAERLNIALELTNPATGFAVQVHTAAHSPAPARPGGIPRPHRSPRQPVIRRVKPVATWTPQ